MRDVEVQVIQKPISVLINCPKCNREMNRTYDDFCDEFGEPCDWNYSETRCWHCGEEISIYGSDWT